MFTDGATLIVDFAFAVLGVHRLEARASLINGRGNGALRKLGAVKEVVLRRSFLRNGEYQDQALWTILQDEWVRARTVWGSRVIMRGDVH
jgi:RimJ/RimL family protein N-acetyltransferase